MSEKKAQEQAVAIPQKPQALSPFPEIQSIAQAFFESGLFPGIAKQAQAVVKIVAGQELGFPPMFSMMNIDIVLGRVRLNSLALAALVKRSGRYDYRVKSHTDTECVLAFTDEAKDVYESRFSISEAQRAGLVKPNSGWAMYPRAMLFARAVSQGAKIVCPHLIAGASTLEDEGLEEINGEIAKEGEPPPSAWRNFWFQAKQLNLEEDGVHNLLGVVSVRDWLSQGKTLEEAIEKLKAYQGSEAQVKAQRDIDVLYGSERVAKVQIPVIPPAVDSSEPPDDDTAPCSEELRETILIAARRRGMTQPDMDNLKAKLFPLAERGVPIASLTGAEGRRLLWAVEDWEPDAPK